MKSFILLLLSSSLTWAVDIPSCYWNNLFLNGTANVGIIKLQFRDANPTVGSRIQYSGHLYLDDATMTSATDVVAVGPSIGGTVNYTIVNGAFGTGTKNPMDGNQHKWYFTMDSPALGTITTCSNNGWYYKYNVSSATHDFIYPLYGVGSISRAATPTNLGIVFNSSDTYSVGSAGTVICTVGGTQLKDDGVAGYYINLYGMAANCGAGTNHVHKITMSAASDQITKATFDTAYAAISPAFAADEQFLALAWCFPSTYGAGTITGDSGPTTITQIGSIPGYFWNGSAPSARTIFASSQVGIGSSTTTNDYFLSTSATPFTDTGKRPTMMLAYMKCNGGGTPTGAACSSGTTIGVSGSWAPDFTTAAARLTQSHNARDTNPTGGKLYIGNDAGDVNAGYQYFLTSTLAYTGAGAGIAPIGLNIQETSILNVTTIVKTDILGYYQGGGGQTNAASTPGFLNTGTGYMLNTTSTTGILAGVNQAPTSLNLLYGAAFSCGSSNEPFGIITTKYPEFNLMMSAYTHGDSAIGAIAKSMKDPFWSNCVGDPLAAPFLPPAPVATATFFVP